MDGDHRRPAAESWSYRLVEVEQERALAWRRLSHSSVSEHDIADNFDFELRVFE